MDSRALGQATRREAAWGDVPAPGLVLVGDAGFGVGRGEGGEDGDEVDAVVFGGVELFDAAEGEPAVDGRAVSSASSRMAARAAVSPCFSRDVAADGLPVAGEGVVVGSLEEEEFDAGVVAEVVLDGADGVDGNEVGADARHGHSAHLGMVASKES